MAEKPRMHRMYLAQREKIQASMIVNRLQDCIAGKIELTSQQVAAARTLLNKVLPDLSATEISGELETRSVMRLPEPATSVEEWKPLSKPN